MQVQNKNLTSAIRAAHPIYLSDCRDMQSYKKIILAIDGFTAVCSKYPYKIKSEFEKLINIVNRNIVSKAPVEYLKSFLDSVSVNEEMQAKVLAYLGKT